MSNRRWWKWLLLFFLILSQYLLGGEGDNDYKEWIILGIGQGSPQDRSAGLSYNFGKKYLFQVSVNSNADFSLSNSSPFLNFFSIASGKRLMNRFTHVSFFAGPAFLWGSNKYIDRSDNWIRSFGLMLNIQEAFKPLPGLGVGLDTFYLLNYNRNCLGIRMILFIGNNK